MDKEKPVKTKPISKSKTFWLGATYTASGSLVVVLQILDVLEPALAETNTTGLSPAAATWIGVALALIGAGQIWLRFVTSQPIGKPPQDEPEPEPEETK